jgi:hypothetical protein
MATQPEQASPAREDPDARVRRRRLLISEVLVTGLIAVAYSEPVGVVRDALQHEGVSIQGLALFVVYFLTVLRFFIGDILHLEEEELTDSRAQVKWFFDLCFIVPECVLLIFLGDLTSLHENETSNIGFFDLLAALLVLDMIWILLMAGLNRLNKSRPKGRFASFWGRENIPYGWALLNGVLLAVLYPLGFVFDHRFPTWKLWLLVAISVVAFVIDVFVLNYYLARKESDNVTVTPAFDTRDEPGH